MIGLALVNRFLVAPILSQGMSRRRIWLRISVLAETILGLLILAAAFILGNSAPP
jgi:putative copper export protein